MALALFVSQQETERNHGAKGRALVASCWRDPDKLCRSAI